MSNNNLNRQTTNEYTISALMHPKVLNALTEENQRAAIDTVKEVYSKEKDGGILGKLLGTNRTNLSMHIALIMSVVLILAGCYIQNNELWDKITTIVAATLGYIFGATQKDK